MLNKLLTDDFFHFAFYFFPIFCFIIGWIVFFIVLKDLTEDGKTVIFWAAMFLSFIFILWLLAQINGLYFISDYLFDIFVFLSLIFLILLLVGMFLRRKDKR